MPFPRIATPLRRMAHRDRAEPQRLRSQRPTPSTATTIAGRRESWRMVRLPSGSTPRAGSGVPSVTRGRRSTWPRLAKKVDRS